MAVDDFDQGDPMGNPSAGGFTDQHRDDHLDHLIGAGMNPRAAQQYVSNLARVAQSASFGLYRPDGDRDQRGQTEPRSAWDQFWDAEPVTKAVRYAGRAIRDNPALGQVAQAATLGVYRPDGEPDRTDRQLKPWDSFARAATMGAYRPDGRGRNQQGPDNPDGVMDQIARSATFNIYGGRKGNGAAEQARKQEQIAQWKDYDPTTGYVPPSQSPGSRPYDDFEYGPSANILAKKRSALSYDDDDYGDSQPRSIFDRRR